MKQSIDLERKKVDSVDSLTESFLKDDFLIDKFEYENTKSLLNKSLTLEITDTNRISMNIQMSMIRFILISYYIESIRKKY